jgi:hypothetical protein
MKTHGQHLGGEYQHPFGYLKLIGVAWLRRRTAPMAATRLFLDDFGRSEDLHGL